MRYCMDWRSVRFDWNRAKAFLVSAEEGSFSAAARALGVSQPTIGRQVAQLEEELGVTLFERIGNALELTTAGGDLVEHVREMGEAATRVSLSATGRALSVEGPVCVTASELVAAHLLGPAVLRVREAHPAIELEIVASNSARDLRRREADIAIRNFQPKEPDLIARKVGESMARVYAAPSYLERVGPLEAPEDLERAELFAFDRSTLMIDGLRRLGVELTRAHFPVVTENHLVQWELCKRGVALCMVMEEVGDAEPAVVRVAPDVAFPVPLWVTAHREVRTSRRIRVVFDLLVEWLAR